MDYTFFQIGVDAPVVADNLNCGNISCAVGPFAVDEGLVRAREPVTVVRVFNTNTGKFIEEHVPVRGGRALTAGDAAITGVPGTGAGIDVFFEDPGGAATGKLLPSGNVRDTLHPPGLPAIEATLIDCSNPVMMVRAADMDICSRVVSVGAFHKTHPITSGIALAAAAGTPGTIAHELVGRREDERLLRVGHPWGVMPVKIHMEGAEVRKAGTVRTARRIMEGWVHLPE